jgi:hypothetical protein
LAKDSALSRLVSGLRREPHDFRPTLQVFPELKPDRIAADMKLGDLGGERGRRNEPPEESATLDDVEMRIVERVESAKNEAHATLIEELRVFAKRLGGLDFEERFSTIRHAAPAAVGNFRAEAVQGRDELFSKRRHIMEVEKERDEFKRENGITRVARHSQGGSLTLKVGILVVVLVLEILLNGVFLSKGSELGLLGGVVEATTFAALNVFISFAIGGVGVRRINQRRILPKLIGFLSIIVYLAFAFGLNLSLAHYRDVMGSMADDAGREVMNRLTINPLGISDLKSWLFFFVGLSFSAVAFGDAFVVFDPYPGFGPLQKRVDAAHDDYRGTKEALIERLADIRDDAIKDMEDANRDLSLRRGEHDAITESRARVIQLFTAYQDHLERTANTLLSAYREANARARNGASAPARFATPYRMERISAALDTGSETAREDLRRSIAEAQAVLVKQVEAIHAEFERALKTYKELEEVIPEGNDGSAQLKVA